MNKKKNWLFDPEQHGGAGNMYVFWLSVSLAPLGFLLWLINQIFNLW